MNRVCPNHAAPVQGDEAERWKALQAVSTPHTPFCRLDYVRAVASGAGLHLGIHIVSENGQDMAGAAVTWKRRGPWREAIVPPFTPFSAVTLRDALNPADIHSRTTPLESLLAELEAGYDRIHVHLDPEYTDIRPAQWRGWTTRPLYTYRLNTGDGPETWSKGAARTFRSGKDAYDLLEGNGVGSTAALLAAASYARQGRKTPLDKAALEALVRTVENTGLASSFAVRRRDSGDIQAGIVVLHANRKGYYWVVGSVPGPAMTVLLGKMLPRLHASGIEEFDLMGANTPTIAEFKRRFGARLTSYYRIGFCRKPMLQWLCTLREMRR
ncbi:MAG: GNAT family N-acetyltransferase [Bacteroidetes bacterium SB0662_bin_6]|nr:GNAT family N-acetyltransferase [Bacteroidetes bacterium SB0668_bin_1]MYE03577.1 GNAT family N-acetyltransferase [Bacteroidetes bacterium SB0662_bin_6]